MSIDTRRLCLPIFVSLTSALYVSEWLALPVCRALYLPGPFSYEPCCHRSRLHTIVRLELPYRYTLGTQDVIRVDMLHALVVVSVSTDGTSLRSSSGLMTTLSRLYGMIATEFASLQTY